MADYVVTGQRGAGKSLVMIGRIKEQLLRGRAVATNLDVDVFELFKDNPDIVFHNFYRLPDRPVGADMHNLGLGCTSMSESDFGDIILDELAIWLNARNWQSDGRQSLLDYLVQSRKHGWNTFMITQLLTSLDKQARGLLEHHVRCSRADRLRIPLIGWLISFVAKLFGLSAGKLPQVHLGHVTYGTGPTGIMVDRWVYRGKHLYNAYNTNQKFADDYPHGTYCYLPPSYLVEKRFKLGLPVDNFNSFHFMQDELGRAGYAPAIPYQLDYVGRPSWPVYPLPVLSKLIKT